MNTILLPGLASGKTSAAIVQINTSVKGVAQGVDSLSISASEIPWTSWSARRIPHSPVSVSSAMYSATATRNGSCSCGRRLPTAISSGTCSNSRTNSSATDAETRQIVWRTPSAAASTRSPGGSGSTGSS